MDMNDLVQKMELLQRITSHTVVAVLLRAIDRIGYDQVRKDLDEACDVKGFIAEFDRIGDGATEEEMYNDMLKCIEVGAKVIEFNADNREVKLGEEKPKRKGTLQDMADRGLL